MAIFSIQTLVAEPNAYRQFIQQLAVTASSQALELPTRLPDGSLLPPNCMLVLQCDENFNYTLGNESGAIDATTNPGIFVLADAQERVRRSANFLNPQTHLIIKAAGVGLCNVFYCNLKTDIPQSGDLTIY